MHEEFTYSISQRRQKRKIRRIGILFSRLIFLYSMKDPKWDFLCLGYSYLLLNILFYIFPEQKISFRIRLVREKIVN